MVLFRRLCCLVAVLMLIAGAIACGGSSSPTPTSPAPQPSDGVPISGSERLGWQVAASRQPDAPPFAHFIYVDGQRSELKSVSCSAASAGTYACDSALPSLSKGRHVLELSLLDRTTGMESAKSAGLVVVAQ